MAKRPTSYTPALPARPAGVTAYRWLYDALRAEILEGRRAPGTRLPSTRDLAAQYALSRGTVVLAFEQLRSEGYTEGSVGSGTFVSRTLPDALLHVAATANAVVGAPARRRLAGQGRRLRLFPVIENRPSRAFRPNLPALDLFPTTLWAQLTARRLRRASTGLLTGCGAMGHRPLQQAVSAYLGASRGVPCAPSQVAIVSGVQEALDIAARLFVEPGDHVGMEDPGYTGATNVLEAVGARLRFLPVDDEGVRPVPSLLRGVRLVYVTPAHQFPLGTTLSLARRLALLDWARQTGALVFEDDYDSEYRYSSRPVPALCGLDRGGHVLFAGSFSKVLFPSLRLGYLVVPPDLVERVEATKSVTSRHPPLLEQAVLADFIDGGHFARHLRRMRLVYAERLGALQDGARAHLRGLLAISPVEAGLQTSAWLEGGLDSQAVATAAAARGVEVTPLLRYARRPLAREGLQLGFAAVDTAEIGRGVRELARAIEVLRAGPSSPTRPPRRSRP